MAWLGLGTAGMMCSRATRTHAIRKRGLLLRDALRTLSNPGMCDDRSPAKNRSATSGRDSDRNRSDSVVLYVLKLPAWILAKAFPFSIVSAQRRRVVTLNTAEFGRIPGLVGEDWQRV